MLFKLSFGIALACCCSPPSGAAAQGGVSFSSAGGALTITSSPYFEAAFSALNGSFMHVRDLRAGGATVLFPAGATPGGPGCLFSIDQNDWADDDGGASTSSSSAASSVLSACDFSAAAGDFAWSWGGPSNLALTLSFGGGGGGGGGGAADGGLSATVTVAAYNLSAHLDITFTLLAGPAAGSGGGIPFPLTRLTFPSGFAFDASLATAAYVPQLPGMALLPPFFERGASWGFLYPNVGSWASLGHVALSIPGHFASGAPSRPPPTACEHPPGPGASAAAASGFAMFDLSGPDTLLPHVFRFSPSPGDGGGGGSSNPYTYVHEHPVNITSGCSPTNNATGAQPASSPPCAVSYTGSITRRLLVGVSDPFAATIAYAAANGMLDPAAAPSVAAALETVGSPASAGPAWGPSSPVYPTLLQKAASIGPDFASQWFAAPLMKLDARSVNLPFAEYAAKIYPFLPTPSIPHNAAVQVGGHDHSYPSFLPPDPALQSTTCDLAGAIAAANAAGLITMPYLNPTWWDPKSVALQPLSPEQLLDVAVLNSSGQIDYEIYGPTTFGLVTTPYSPFVQSAIAAYMAQFSRNLTSSSARVAAAAAASAASTDVLAADPAVADAPCNASAVEPLPFTFLFEDQLSARYAKIDFSPHASGMGPLAYTRGWQDHIARYASVGLHSEQGVDRHARHILGFWGSIEGGLPGGPCGVLEANDWASIPLVPAAMRRIVTLNQHDLSGNWMALNSTLAAWDISRGMQLSLDVSTLPYGLVPQSWVDTVGAMQNQVLGRYTHFSLTGWQAATAGSGSAGAGTGLASLSLPPPSLSFPPTVSWSLFSSDGMPLLRPWHSSNYTALVSWDGSAPANVSAPAYGPQSGGPTPFVATLVPWGWLVFGGEGDVVGGMVQDQWAGAPLDTPSGEAHVIVEDRTCGFLLGAGGGGGSNNRSAVCVWHPLGNDTHIRVRIPPSWGTAQQQAAVTATPVDKFGAPVGAVVPATPAGDGLHVSFLWQRAQSSLDGGGEEEEEEGRKRERERLRGAGTLAAAAASEAAAFVLLPVGW